MQSMPCEVREFNPVYQTKPDLATRLLTAGPESFHGIELLELILKPVLKRRSRSVVKALQRSFGTVAAIVSADPAELAQVDGMTNESIAALKVCKAIACELLRESAHRSENVFTNWKQLLDYCQAAIGNNTVETTIYLFLDRKNRLISVETGQRGTVDHAPLYVREIVKRALMLNASAMIVSHNHPSGDPKPSEGDIQVTRLLKDGLKPLGIVLHDHLIVSRTGHTSFRTEGLL